MLLFKASPSNLPCRKAAMQFCQHQLALHDCMSCSTGLDQRDARSYLTVSTIPNKKDLKRSHWEAILHCGSQFQQPVDTNQGTRQKRRKTSVSRQYTAWSATDNEARHASHRESNPLSTSPTPIQSTEQSSIPTSSHNQPPSSRQHTALNSFPILTHPNISQAPPPRTSHPPSTAHSYQLNRFLYETPDFRTSLYFEKQARCSGRSGGIRKSRILKTRLRSLQRCIERF
ncbi:hypothetical protein V8E51_009479 [Hyaloscypha variabilis]